MLDTRCDQCYNVDMRARECNFFRSYLFSLNRFMNMTICSNNKINYDLIREIIGTVVTDDAYEYVVCDYSFANNTMELWCKTRQRFYKVTPKAFDSMTCISGTI